MTLGIIGAGAIGQALARQALHAGHDAVLANRRGPDARRRRSSRSCCRARGW